VTQNIATAVSEVAEVVASVTGVNAAPSTPQENINERVFALTYLMSNFVEISETGTKQNLANIAVDLLTPNSPSLEAAISTLLPLVDSVSTALITEVTDVTKFFDGSIDTFEDLRVEFIPFYPYSGVDCIAYRFTLENVKQKIGL
jgi:hypothetical protein